MNGARRGTRVRKRVLIIESRQYKGLIRNARGYESRPSSSSSGAIGALFWQERDSHTIARQRHGAPPFGLELVLHAEARFAWFDGAASVDAVDAQPAALHRIAEHGPKRKQDLGPRLRLLNRKHQFNPLVA